MSQKSKLRRKQRNRAESERYDEPQGHQYGDAAEYFEQQKIKWEKSQKEADHGKN